MDILDQTKKKMAAAIDHLKEELKNIRTGRANPGLFEGVFVDAYGSQMRIKDLATITAPEPRQLLISPFDGNMKGPIGKAIEKANLGFMPIVEGNVIRIRIPAMDQKQRDEMVKLCHKRREEAKVSVRNARRDSNEEVKQQKSKGIISEDDMKRFEKHIQELTDKFCHEADDLSAKKEKEISTI